MEHDPTLDMDKTKLNTSEVSRLTGLGRSTIRRHAKKGDISFEIDKNGNKLFDVSELNRVYADEIQKAAIGNGKIVKSNTDGGSLALKIAQEKLAVQYEDRIAFLEKALEKALDIPPLLEDHSSERKEWETLLESKVSKLANQTEQRMAEQDKRHQQETDKWKRRYLHERNKSWLEKLFSKKKRAGKNQGTTSNA